MSARLDPIVAAELRRCPLPWSLDDRRRHVLVRIAGEVVTKVPHGQPKQGGRASLNVRAAIRKYVREHLA
ncbi:hypothetical protein [Antarcticirhabdus aurantiaca]|uniref:hypothetical protein n=1 Tax=Antarcticirhabdus aurantiaca TaxID=2606717 RepID=UPI00131EC3C2|nr:hypothetical protein [Antarcticirhabdus aurantiaca]